MRTALRTLVEAPPYYGRALSLGRELAAYVIAADIIGLTDPRSGIGFALPGEDQAVADDTDDRWPAQSHRVSRETAEQLG